MADVKTLTVHGIPYSIKDETARNNITTLSPRVSTLESKVDNHAERITQNETDITQINGNLDNVENDVAGLTARITENEVKINTLDTRVDNIYPFYNLLINPTFRYNRRGSSQYTGAGYTRDMWYADGTNPNVSGGDSDSVTISAGTRLRQKFMASGATLSNNLTVLIQSPTQKVTKPITVPFSGTVGEFTVNVTADHEFNIMSTTGATISWVGLYVGHYLNVDFTFVETIEQLKLQKYIAEIRGLFDLFTSWGNYRMSNLNLRFPLSVPLYYNNDSDIRIYFNFLNNMLYGETSDGSSDVQVSALNTPAVTDNGGTNMSIGFTKTDNTDFATSHYWTDGHIILYAEPKF